MAAINPLALNGLRFPAEFARLIRFALVGTLSTTIYFLSSIAMVEAVGLPPVASSAIGQLCAVGVSYFGHSIYSFRVRKDHKKHAWRFFSIAAGTLCLNMLVTWLLADVIRLPYLIAFGVIVVLIPSVNYMCNRFWVFRGAIDKRAHRSLFRIRLSHRHQGLPPRDVGP